jgi:peptide/nickel transport system ATP-binding protein
MIDETVLKVDNLSIHFSTYEGTVRAVENVSFEIGKGEWFGLVGETGCGKSVTALSILRLLPVSAKIINGSIKFGDLDLAKASENQIRSIRGSKIPMIFQDPGSSLNPSMRVGRQMEETIILHQKVKKKEARALAQKMLEQAGIPEAKDCLNLYPHELSGGMQQRILIGLALSCQPSLLIADEPTTNLDVTIQAEIIGLMRSLQEQFGMSVLLITHDLGIIAGTCRRVAVMYAGNIVEQGFTQEVLQHGCHPYTKALLHALPTIKNKKEILESIPGRVPSLLGERCGCMFNSRCAFSMEGECDVKSPVPVEIEPGHIVACHLALPKGEA